MIGTTLLILGTAIRISAMISTDLNQKGYSDSLKVFWFFSGLGFAIAIIEATVKQI